VLREDILSVAGPGSAIRREWYDFVAAELRARESACPHRIKPVRQLPENQRDHLLAFAVWNWAVIRRPWPGGGRSVVRPLERSWKCKPCRCATRGAGGARRRCERH
jgi:hypothetical protein